LLEWLARGARRACSSRLTAHSRYLRLKYPSFLSLLSSRGGAPPRARAAFRPFFFFLASVVTVPLREIEETGRSGGPTEQQALEVVFLVGSQNTGRLRSRGVDWSLFFLSWSFACGQPPHSFCDSFFSYFDSRRFLHPSLIRPGLPQLPNLPYDEPPSPLRISAG